jgi:hypothetical protein
MTKLAVLAAAPGRDPDGRLRIKVTVTNAGSLPADQPSLAATGFPAARWESGCTQGWRGCQLPALAAGESRTLELASDTPTRAAGA